MIKQKWIRLTLGAILGGFAGLSLTSSVLPTIVSTLGGGDSFFIRWALSDYAAHTTLLWAVGGWSVAKVGIPRAGAVILGVVGLCSGLLLGGVALGTQATLLLTTGLGGGAYGVLGGLLLGGMLRSDSEPTLPAEGD